MAGDRIFKGNPGNRPQRTEGFLVGHEAEIGGTRPQDIELTQGTTPQFEQIIGGPPAPVYQEPAIVGVDNSLKAKISRHRGATMAVGAVATVLAAVGGTAIAMGIGGNGGNEGGSSQGAATASETPTSGNNVVVATETQAATNTPTRSPEPTISGTAIGKGVDETPTKVPATPVPATSTPVPVAATPRPATPTATAEATKPAETFDTSAFPAPLKKAFDDITRLNKSGVIKDATTGKPLSDVDIKQAYYDPLLRASTFTDANPLKQALIRSGGLTGALSPLQAAYLSNRNGEIQVVCKGITLFFKTTYPDQFKGTADSGAFIPECLP